MDNFTFIRLLLLWLVGVFGDILGFFDLEYSYRVNIRVILGFWGRFDEMGYDFYFSVFEIW